MDELARRYLLLALRLDRLSPGFIDSYVGPPELREIAHAEPMPLAAELHAEAMALAELAEGLPNDDPPSVRRRAWFAGQLRAMSAVARQAGGEEIGYLAMLEERFGLPVRPAPDEDLAQARAELLAVLPGSGDLQARITALRTALRVPPKRLLDATRASAERFRAITRRDFDLPDDEGIEWQAVHDRPWGAFAQFRGSGRTRVELNLDLPTEVSAVAFLAAHEGYPGHHADHVVKEVTLIREAGLGEATLRTMNTPEAVLAEGLADIGREVVMSDREFAVELGRIGRAVGIDGDWETAMRMRVAVNELQLAMGNAAIMLHHHGRPDAEVRAYLTEVGMVAADRLEHSMRVLHDPVNRIAVFTYTEGARIIRPWLEIEGQTGGLWRLISEQLSPAVLLADLAAASPLGEPA